MPTYLPPLNGISLSQALAEAAAIAPSDRAILDCYEIRHPLMVAPLRFVNDHTDLVATLEAGAPVGAGTSVTFYACPVSIGEIEESPESASPEVTLILSDVNSIINQVIPAGRDINSQWEITERQYASDDLTGPAKLPPLTLTIVNCEMVANSARLTCSFGESHLTAIPRATFEARHYPSLRAK